MAGCKHANSPTPTPQAHHAKDTTTLKSVPKKSFCNLKVVEDTTFGGWHIITQIANNNIKVKSANRFDQSLFVTISKDGHRLFNHKELTTPGLLGYSDSTLTLNPGSVWLITNTTVYLFSGTYEWETDNGYSFILAFSKDGSFKAYPSVPSLDNSDIVTDFFTMYIHELQQKHVDTPSLRKIAKAYGTSRFVEHLAQKGRHAILPSKVMEYPLSDIEVSSGITEEMESSKSLYGHAIFYERKHSTPIDSLRFKLTGKKNEYGSVDYDQIDEIMLYTPSQRH